MQRALVFLILINAVVLGLETHPAMGAFSSLFFALDRLCLLVFAAEMIAKLILYRWRFFRSGWNCFDFLVISIALLPAAGPLAVLRTLRVLRVLRLLTVVPSLRRVVAAFLQAIPGLGSVILVMSIFFYVAAVLATRLFGQTHPEFFGSLGGSLYTLFQIMTLESWSMGIVRPVMEQHPWAWCFFIPFIFMATFTILNLFIGIIVSTMQDLSRKEGHEGSAVASTPPGGVASDQAVLPSLPSLTAARSPLVATSLAAPLPLRPRRGRRRARPLL
ncbi:MAG: ion transporter [Polyangiaceae bacterium]|nr:ion transporter [Polyangiaceae bacterium]